MERAVLAFVLADQLWVDAVRAAVVVVLAVLVVVGLRVIDRQDHADPDGSREAGPDAPGPD